MRIKTFYFQFLFFVYSSLVLAYDWEGVDHGLKNPAKVLPIFKDQDHIDLFSLLKFFLNLIIYIATPILFVIFVYIGFTYLTAQGDSKKIEKANSWLLYASIGAVIIYAGPHLIDVIKNTIDKINTNI